MDACSRSTYTFSFRTLCCSILLRLGKHRTPEMSEGPLWPSASLGKWDFVVLLGAGLGFRRNAEKLQLHSDDSDMGLGCDGYQDSIFLGFFLTLRT